MKSTIATFLLWSLFPVITFAEPISYYVDATLGNNDLDGKSRANAWQTLARVNDANTLAPGDSVLFKCGEFWRGNLVVRSPGITFGRYGTNCSESNKPEIRASELISGWSVPSGQAYYVADVSFPVKQVFVGGQYLKLAQYPSSGYLTVDSAETTTDANGNKIPVVCNYLVDTDLSKIPNQPNSFVGAGIHVRTANWRIEDWKVGSFNGSTNKLTLVTNRPENVNTTCPESNNHTVYAIAQGYGYYLDNQRWMLAPGSWYYEPPAPGTTLPGKLYVWLSDNALPNDINDIEASRYDYGIYTDSKTDITIDGLRIKHAALDGVTFTNARRFTANNLEILDSGRVGLEISAGSQGSVEYSLIRNSVNEGIDITTSSGIYNPNLIYKVCDSVHNRVRILGNRVENSGTVGSPKNSLAAIHAEASDNVEISNNVIQNAGYIGIRFKRNSCIQNNVVEYTCSVLDDCGAIYAWSGIDNSRSAFNSEVSGNIVVNALGSSLGKPAGPTLAAGIYLDDLSNDIDVLNNTVVNTDAGIFLHNAYNNLVQGNVTYGNRQIELWLGEDSAAGDLRGNKIEKNTLFPWAYAESVNLTGKIAEIVLSGDTANIFDSNRYSELYSDRLVSDSYPLDQQLYFTLPQWQQPLSAGGKNQDLNSTRFNPFRIALYESLSPPNPSNLIINSTFDTDVIYWTDDTTNNDHLTWQPQCDSGGGCMKFSAVPEKRVAYAKFSIYKDRTYLVRADLKAGQPSQVIKMLVTRVGPTYYDELGLHKKITVGAAWDTYTFVFKATGDGIVTPDTWGARLYFEVGAGQQLYIDNVVVEEIAPPFNDPSDDSAILINTASNEAAMPCPDGANSPKCFQYIRFPDGTPVTGWPITVPAMRSVIVVWNNNPAVDSDRDSVAESIDLCPGTPPGLNVDEHGCSFSQNHPADLTPTTLTASRSGTNLLINDSVKNQGYATAGAFDISYYLSTDATYQPGTDTFLCQRSVTFLAAGASHPTSGTTQSSCPVPNVAAGNYYVIAVADSGNTVTESNEANNTASVSTTVGLGCNDGYPITPVTSLGGGTGATNEEVKVTFTGNIKNAPAFLTKPTTSVLTLCPNTTVRYQASATRGQLVCRINNNIAAPNGRLRIHDNLLCTNRPGGGDTDKFFVK